MRMLHRWLCLLVLGFAPPLWGAGYSISAGVDVMALDALWQDQLTLRADLVLHMPDGFGLRLPVTWIRSLGFNETDALRYGAMVDYHPFDCGFFLSLGLFESVRFFGSDKPAEDHIYLHSVAVGWTIPLTKHLRIEPKLLCLDPSGVFASEEASYEEALGDPGRFRFSCDLLVECPVPGWKGNKRKSVESGGEEERR